MLEYVKECIKKRKTANIVYLGGSITEGQGVADRRLCWQGLVQSALERDYPDCRFEAVNAGIGGTDSRFGAFRMERDVLPHRPDLLMVEFAVNDYTRDKDSVREALEAILYKLWGACPKADVLFVFTASEKMYRENYLPGRTPDSVEIHTETALRYGIPYINAGLALFLELQVRGLAAQTVLPDLVHPNREGYQAYYRIIYRALSQWLDGGDAKTACEKAPSRRVPENAYSHSRMIPAGEARLAGFQREGIAMCGRFGGYISSDRPGDSLEFSFSGTELGMFYMAACDSGCLEWRLDGGPWRSFSCWDSYALEFDRGSAVMLAEGLHLGRHLLKLRVAQTRPERSLGRFVRIGSFLVSDGTSISYSPCGEISSRPNKG